MPAVKNAAGIRAAKQIATEAAKGTAIGLTFAFGFKFAISDRHKHQIESYYAKHKFEEK